MPDKVFILEKPEGLKAWYLWDKHHIICLGCGVNPAELVDRHLNSPKKDVGELKEKRENKIHR